ncbi:alpha/beta fold hydrolase [Ruegeria sp. 2012CJ41-6]|uniref:Alpha/beta fold hydrolase n=2 Tax=Ruegeria spongiae TaxID=2942209 RepID=A0ABT0Q5I7_9RHOB|nr:alpha/beta fold hydrolase [Ruegeria spongiae]
MYHTWQAEVGDQLEIVAVQPPGRANRHAETPLDSMSDLVQSLLPALLPLTDRPYAFFGHSMGAVFAAYTAKEIVNSGWTPPRRLFLSSRQPPHRPSPVSPLDHLSDQEFVDEINRRYGGIPPEILDEPSILELLLPALRADIRVLERVEGDMPHRLPIPITAYGGNQDPLVSSEMLASWQDWTSRPLDLNLFQGGHFYLNDVTMRLLTSISSALRQSRVAKEGLG